MRAFRIAKHPFQTVLASKVMTYWHDFQLAYLPFLLQKKIALVNRRAFGGTGWIFDLCHLRHYMVTFRTFLKHTKEAIILFLECYAPFAGPCKFIPAHAYNHK